MRRRRQPGGQAHQVGLGVAVHGEGAPGRAGGLLVQRAVGHGAVVTADGARAGGERPRLEGPPGVAGAVTSDLRERAGRGGRGVRLGAVEAAALLAADPEGLLATSSSSASWGSCGQDEEELHSHC